MEIGTGSEDPCLDSDGSEAGPTSRDPVAPGSGTGSRAGESWMKFQEAGCRHPPACGRSGCLGADELMRRDAVTRRWGSGPEEVLPRTSSSLSERRALESAWEIKIAH